MRRTFATSVVLVAVLSFAALPFAAAQTDPPRETEVAIGGVSIRGQSVISSVEVPREPLYVLHNTTTHTRTITLARLVSLGQGERQTLVIRSPRTITLAPGATEEITVDFEGSALQSSAGLSYHRFSLRVRVGNDTGDAISSVGYSCRMPLDR